jgi:hypothetical protein
MYHFQFSHTGDLLRRYSPFPAGLSARQMAAGFKLGVDFAA